MKMFTKLALVSSMAISANAMAMQSMDDAALSAATGQDGINIGIGISRIEIEKVLIHDNDGLTADGGRAAFAGTVFADQAALNAYNSDPANAGNQLTLTDIDPRTVITAATGTKGGTGNAGAIVIKADGKTGSATKDHGIVIGANYDNNGANLLASRNLVDLVIDTDGGTGTGNTAFLNIAAKVSGLNINIGEIGVSGSSTYNANAVRRGNNDSNYNQILTGLSLKTGQMDANIQLGATPQGAMIKLNTTMSNGLEIKNLGIVDNSTALAAVTEVKDANGNVTTPAAAARAKGVIQLDSIKLSDANDSTKLTVAAAVSVFGEQAGVNKGYLRIITGSGATTPKTDMYIKGIHLGSATAGSIGDVEVQGMQTYFSPSAGVYVPGSVITISGH